MCVINKSNKNEKRQIPCLFVIKFVIQDVFSSSITHSSSKNRSTFRELQELTVYTIRTWFITTEDFLYMQIISVYLLVYCVKICLNECDR